MDCLKCGHQQPDGTAVCPRCGAVHAKVRAVAGQGAEIRRAHLPTAEEEAAAAELRRRLRENPDAAAAHALRQAKATGRWDGIPPELRRAAVATLVVATTPELPGRQVSAVLGLVAGEYAYAFGAIGEELGGLVRNVVGSGASVDMMARVREGREHALAAMRQNALALGADAVVGARFDFEEFSGANQRGTLVVVVTGTAVRLAAQASPSL